MKIPASVRRLFEDQKGTNERLKVQVDARIQGLKDSRWHYEGRIKGLASFALKLESGRFAQPQALEDFFACTLVVPNAAEIERAQRIVLENFALVDKRPPHSGETHKSPDAFPFDDLRLYITLPHEAALPPTDLTGVVFELQIKTFLQHAWAIATHDLVYKTDDANWSKERIAYQTKAMLEHAEMSIQEAELLATCTSLAKQDRRTAQTKEGIALVKRQWSSEELPSDVRRLTQNILHLLEGLGIDWARLEQVLESGKQARSGMHPANLSPFLTIVQYLFGFEKDRMKRLLEGRSSGSKRVRILIPTEVEMPADIDRQQLRNGIFVEYD